MLVNLNMGDKMKIIRSYDSKSLWNMFHSFMAGAIIMACISGYNRTQMPLAIICLIGSIIFNSGDE